VLAYTVETLIVNVVELPLVAKIETLLILGPHSSGGRFSFEIFDLAIILFS
jgi:hypothetical protein